MQRILLLTACSALLIACSGTKNATGQEAPPTTPTAARFGGEAAADSLFFSFERTPCFGRCATFVIKVYRSGHATYEGKQHVERLGRFTGRLSPEGMAKLLADAEAIGFWQRPAEYNSQVTDLPSTLVRVVSGARDHQVRARYKVPEDFKAFAARSEELLLAIDWQPAATGQ